MKENLKGIGGLLIIGIFLYFIGMSVYKRNFAEPEFMVLKSAPISSPVKNAIFWYQEDLEKTEPRIGIHLSADASSLTEAMYKDLKTSGMVTETVKTMSEKATQEMIRLNAYRGTEPDILQEAAQNNYPYVFKVMITDADWKKMTSALQSVTYHFTLYDIAKNEIIWEAETVRLGGFFGGMPDNEKTISEVRKHLKEAKIIQ